MKCIDSHSATRIKTFHSILMLETYTFMRENEFS